MLRPLRAGERISFGCGGRASRFIVQPGWHVPEEKHCWTARSAALFAFNPLFKGDAFLHLEFFVLSERSWADTQLAIALNNRTIFDANYRSSTDRVAVRVGQILRAPTDINILTIYCEPRSPHDLTGSGDTRLLGIAVKNLWFEQ